MKPRGVSECLPTSQWQQRHIEVLAELRRRRTQQEQQATEAQARAMSKDEGRSIAAFFESPVTIDDVAAARMKVIAKKALPFVLVDDPIFRGAIEHRAHGEGELEDSRGRRSPAAHTQEDVLYCAFPPLIPCGGICIAVAAYVRPPVLEYKTRCTYTASFVLRPLQAHTAQLSSMGERRSMLRSTCAVYYGAS
jgi:hypothetical protein